MLSYYLYKKYFGKSGSTNVLDIQSQPVNKTYKAVPGPRPSLVTGNIRDLSPDLWSAAKYLNAKYGDIVVLHILGRKFYIVRSPEYSEVLLNLVDKNIPPQPLAAEGIFLADGEKWRIANKLLTPAFIPSKMQQYSSVFNKKAQIFATYVSLQAQKGNSIEIQELAENLMFESICEIGFNYKTDLVGKNEKCPFGKNFDFLLEQQIARSLRPGFVNYLPFLGNSEYNHAFKELTNQLDEILDQKVDNRKDILASLLNNGEGNLSRENLRDQLITLLVAGHKTSALLLSWSLYQLARHPDIEKKVIEEINSLTDETVSFNDLAKLPYLEQVLNETIRLHPPAQSVVRGTREPIELGEYLIEANSSIFINVMDTHVMEKYWGPDATAFNPDRFSPDKVEKFHPYQFIPFGGGKRRCLGNVFAKTEVKTVLVHLYRKFRPRIPENFVLIPSNDPLVPKSGLHIRFVEVGKEQEGSWSVSQPNLNKLLSPCKENPDYEPNKNDLLSSVLNEDTVAMDDRLVFVLYGSNHGTCQSVASKLGAGLRSMKLLSVVQSLDSFEFSLLEKDASHTPLHIFIVCSCYNGFPTDDAVNFVASLKQAKPFTREIHYSVFGVGNSQWLGTFLKVPKFIDNELHQRGAKRMLEFAHGDENKYLNNDIEDYETKFYSAVSDKFNIKENLSNSGLRSSFIEEKRYFEVLFVSEDDFEFTVHPLEITTNSLGKFKVVENTELQNPNEGPEKRSTRHIQFQLPHGVTYETGDHFQVLPHNDKELVDKVLTRLGINGDTKIRIEYSGDIPEDSPDWAISGLPISLRNIVTYHADITSPPTKALLNFLVTYATDETEQNELIRLGTEDDYYKEKIFLAHKTLLDVLIAFPSVQNIPLVHLFACFPRLKPRFYSISSSSLVTPDQMSITVGIVDFGNHKGVSSYHTLAPLKVGDEILGAIRKSSFHPTKTNDVICVGAGTGLAPFRGFIHDRKLTNPKTSLTLFFGCRDDNDFIYRNELEEAHSSGLIDLNVAFSRKTAEKVYVNHVMLDKQKELYDLLERKQAYFYVCGDGKGMAKSVFEAWVTIFMNSASLTHDAAVERLAQIQGEGRYVMDVW